MKKILVVLVALTLLASFAFAAPKKKASDLVIPVVYLDVSINFAQPLKAGAEQAGKDTGMKVIFDGPVNFNLDQQVSIIENYITQQVDGLVLAPLSSEVIDPIIKKALDAGIPVVTFNTDSPSSARIAYFGQDVYAVAKEQAKMIAQTTAVRRLLRESALPIGDPRPRPLLPAPDEAGEYNFRVFRDESYQPIATSETIEVIARP